MTTATKASPHHFLSRATDPVAMAGIFQEVFRTEYPGRDLHITHCQVERVEQKPGKECNLLYRVRGHEGGQHAFDQWFRARMAMNGDAGKLLRQEPPVSWPGMGFWKTMCPVPELAMVVYSFPFDQHLPQLGHLLDPAFVQQQVEGHLGNFGVAGNWRCVETAISKVKYRPGWRCLLRYQVQLRDAAGQTRTLNFFGKTYASEQSRYVYRALHALCADPACHRGVLNVPAPILHLDSAHTLWQQAWEGRKFRDVMVELGWPQLPQTGYMPRIGQLLAALHSIPLPEHVLAPGPAWTAMLQEVDEDVEKLQSFLPQWSPAWTEVARHLRAVAPALHAREERRTIHGTFKNAQLLCRGDQFAVVDFDAVALGDPLYDAAEFLASVVYLQASDGVPAAPLDAAVEQFLSAYQEQVTWHCDWRRMAWYLVVFLLGKIHSSCKRREWQNQDGPAVALEVVRKWLHVMQA